MLLNANGLYTGAVVLKRVAGATAPTTSAPAAIEECGVDTDCAGELVCVKRACVRHPAK